jgi:hypothetical protein
MNTNVKTNLTAAAVAISLSVVAPDAVNAVPTAPMGRQIAPADFAARGRELVQQFAMNYAHQSFAVGMAMPRP